jgi:hypothetical protein
MQRCGPFFANGRSFHTSDWKILCTFFRQNLAEVRNSLEKLSMETNSSSTDLSMLKETFLRVVISLKNLNTKKFANSLDWPFNFDG